MFLSAALLCMSEVYDLRVWHLGQSTSKRVAWSNYDIGYLLDSVVEMLACVTIVDVEVNVSCRSSLS